MPVIPVKYWTQSAGALTIFEEKEESECEQLLLPSTGACYLSRQNVPLLGRCVAVSGLQLNTITGAGPKLNVHFRNEIFEY